MQIFFGPPGTGKTRTLIDIVRQEVEGGVPVKSIAFLAFSRRAAAEARARGATDLGLDEDDMRFWSTLHSAAARQLGADIMEQEHWRELGELLDMPLSVPDDEGRVIFPSRPEGGKQAQYIYSIARARLMDLQAAIDWALHPIPGNKVRQFAVTLDRYKEVRGVLDYPDLLDQAPGKLPIDVAVIDEAQDLTPAQWEYALRAVSKADRVYIAGDDDQTIFSWAGASVERFLDLPGERTVLEQSHRLPKQVYEVATRITSRIKHRQPKHWYSRGHEGEVLMLPDHDLIPIPQPKEDWLLLSRTGYQLDRWERLCRNYGIPYTKEGKPSVRPEEARAIAMWERARTGKPVPGAELNPAMALAALPADLPLEQEFTLAQLDLRDVIWHQALVRIPEARRLYYGACLMRDPRALSRRPTVTISTIHGSKGAEATNVALATDTTPRITEGAQRDPDAEHRVWYVGVTRARERLYLVRPSGLHHYAV